MKNFWSSLPNPFFCLAPMENVTDTVFRQIIARTGKPDVFFTEFTNTDGLCSVGRDQVGKRLEFTPSERPLIAQLWGTNPEKFYESAQLLVKMGFDGIDINMGCPVRDVVSHGACSGLIQTPSLAKEIIDATKRGAGDLPVSVKTRIGFKEIETEKWCGFLLGEDIKALTVHGRTAREMSKVPAHWDEIGKVAAIRNEMNVKTRIIGNGDVLSRQDGLDKVNKYGVDGIMIGRGVFHDAWIFNKEKSGESVSPTEKLQLLIEHLRLFEDIWKDKKPPETLKKFYKIYTLGMTDASNFRMELMKYTTIDETVTCIEQKIASL